LIRTSLLRAHAFIAATAAVFAILTSGCATPLAPGYSIQKESLSVQFVPGDPPHLAIRAEYRLANIGNSSLNYIAVTLPGENEFGRADLRAEIDGKEIAPQHNPPESADDWRIVLPSQWRQKEKRNLDFSYDLAAQPATDPRIFVAANTFYLNDSGWFPQLHGFRGLFAPSPTRPDPTTLSIIIPADFRVTASGQPRAASKQNGQVEYRFLIHKGDFDPYVLAGQYNEQRISGDGVTVAVWTVKPIPADQAQKTAAQIAAAEKFYVQNFGPLPKSVKALYDVELPEKASGDNPRYLQGVLPTAVYNWGLPRGGTLKASNNGPTSLLGPMVLGNSWFGHMIRPRPEAWMLGTALDSVSVANAGGQQRSDDVRPQLANYDGETAKAVEKPIISLTPSDPEEQLQIGADKIGLFFFALEDKCGQQNVTHAISDMVYALRGEDYGYSDFRAALEQRCNQNLDGFFRTWLTQPGIPADFRARYENAGGNNNKQ
jgi:hypothetical protein